MWSDGFGIGETEELDVIVMICNAWDIEDING